MAPQDNAGLIGNARPRPSSFVGYQDNAPRLLTRLGGSRARLRYAFGETRVGLLALLTFIVPSGLRSAAVVMAKLVGHAVAFRNSPARQANVWVDLDLHPIWPAAEKRLERGNIFHSVSHEIPCAEGRLAAGNATSTTGRQAEDRSAQP
jgi:hypothetical protein